MREKISLQLLRVLALAHDTGGSLTHRFGVGKSRGAEAMNQSIRWMIGRLLVHVESPFDVQGHKMFLNGRDDLSALVYLNFFEVMEVMLMGGMIKKGGVVLDIGANIGFHTLMFARFVGDKGRVYAFEPDPTNFALLEKNVRANGYQNVEPVRKALSDQNGKIQLYLSKNNKGMHRIYKSRYCDESIEVDMVRLDDYFEHYEGKISFIKMDVEGAEMAVLKGMSTLLRKNRAPMLIEFAPYALKEFGTEPEALLKLIEGYGYKFYYYDEAAKRLDTIGIPELLKSYPPEEQKIINLVCMR